MISGALLLKKEESVGVVLKKRWLRFLVVLFVFSFFQYIVSINFDISQLSLSYFFKKLYSSAFASAYWYLYAYLGYLLMLPLLRKFVSGMRDKDFLYLIALRFVMAFLPIFEFIIWKGEVKHSVNFDIQVVYDVIFYPILGYYAEHIISEKYFTKRNSIVLAIASVAAIMVCCLMTHYYCIVTGNWAVSNGQPFHNTLTFIPIFSLYLAAKQFFSDKKIPDLMCKVITAVSSTIFGIMLIENIARQHTTKIYSVLTPYIGRMPACIVWIGIVCCICSVIIFAVRQIPFVKKFI